jgi:NADH-quinone oxidoreductase subunit J
MANALFYLMSVGAVAAALGTVLARNPIQCVLSLLASFFCLATIYLLAGFQFLAAAQILVYAGAIMVLFLFVIMLLNLGNPGTDDTTDTAMFRKKGAFVGVLVAAATMAAGAMAVTAGALPEAAQAMPEHGIDEIPALAGEMFGRYLLPFEAISILLLATAVAVVVLAKRDRKDAPRKGA